MATIDDLVEGLKSASAIIDLPELEPNPGRSDWATQKGKLEALAATLNDRLLALAPQGLTELDPSEHAGFKDVLARVTGMGASAIAASGDQARGLELLARAASFAANPQLQGELSTARHQLNWFLKLNHARWLRRNGDAGVADTLFEEIRDSSAEAIYRDAARAVLEAPKPLTSAPSLSTLNGFGFGVYGHRDPGPDGSYTATHCFCALFIPIVPLAAYRVVKREDGLYFLGKVPLWSGWTWYRRALAAVVVLAIGGYSFQAWLESPGRLARVAVEHAASVEAAGKGSEAAALYDAALTGFAASGVSEALAPAASGWMRLQLKKVSEPFTAPSLDQVARINLRFLQIPLEVRRGEPTTRFVTRLGAWATQVGADSAENQQASLRLLELAANIAESTELAAVTAQRTALRRQIASGLKAQWPFHALEHYLELGLDPEALEASAGIIAGLGDAPSLVLENAKSLLAFTVRATTPKHAALVTRVKDSLAAASALVSAKGRAELLASGDLARLKADQKKFPGDHETTLAIAALYRNMGDLPAAIAQLEALGAPGWLTSDAHLMLALCYSDWGKPERAEPLLLAWLSRWLPRFQAAKAALISATDAARDRLIADARAGRIDAAFLAKLKAEKDEEAGTRMFSEWLGEQLSANEALQTLRDEYGRLQGVTTASVLLGTLELNRANALTGAAQEKLLRSAERRFLAVQQEAEGTPSYRLGYGKVLHRLGKGAEGDAQFKELLALSEPGVHLSVGHAYRELGLVARAREVYEGIYKVAGQPQKDSAAMSMHVMGTSPEDRALWLERVSVETPEKRAMLAELRGDLLVNQGKYAEADREYEQSARHYEKTASGSAVAANNAAVAYGRRYSCLGDPAQLDKAITSYRSGLRMDAENSIMLGNLAGVLGDRALIAIAARWVKAPLLKLSGSEADTLLGSMRSGPHRDEVITRLRADPRLRESLDLRKKIAVLSPSSFSAYEQQAEWYEVLKDAAALQRVLEQAKRVGRFDDSEERAYRERWAKGDFDVRVAAQLGTQLKGLAAAAKDPDPRTRAAALLLKGRTEASLADLTGGTANLEAALASTREAHLAWPGLGAAGSIPTRLFKLAVGRAVAQEPRWKKAWDLDSRRRSTTVLVWGAAKDEPGLRKVLATQPELNEVATALAQRPDDELGLEAWVIGWVAGDEPLMQRAAGNLRSESRVALNALNTLHDSSDGWAASQALLKLAIAGK